MARKKKADPLKDVMSEYFRKLGSKGGSKRGEAWAKLTEDQRKEKMRAVTEARQAKRATETSGD